MTFDSAERARANDSGGDLRVEFWSRACELEPKPLDRPSTRARWSATLALMDSRRVAPHPLITLVLAAKWPLHRSGFALPALANFVPGLDTQDGPRPSVPRAPN